MEEDENKFTEKIYPRLERSDERKQPTAPPEENFYTNLENTEGRGVNNNNYRLEHIKDIKNNLQQHREKRRALSKRYSKANDVLYYTNYGLNFLFAGAGIACVTTLPTVFFLPLSIGLSATSAVCGGLSLLVNKINKKIKVKEDKHREIYVLAESKLNTIEGLLSKALNNNHIDHNEFQLILEEEKKFNHYRESIRSTSEKKFYEEKGKNEIKESLRKLIGK